MTVVSQESFAPELQAVLGYAYNDSSWLQLAVTHKSYANETSGGSGHVNADNERLEFLGDAVLDLALSDYLMKRFPQDPEGALSKKRASLVNEETLSQIALELKLDQYIRLGKGESKTGGGSKPRILASSLEAIFGSIFSDGGYDPCRSAVERLFAGRVEELSRSAVDFVSDFKTRLQERIQELHKSTPNYRVEGESGPDHDKQFEVSVRLGEEVLALGQGRSKKAAEQNAAQRALEALAPKPNNKIDLVRKSSESQSEEN